MPHPVIDIYLVWDKVVQAQPIRICVRFPTVLLVIDLWKFKGCNKKEYTFMHEDQWDVGCRRYRCCCFRVIVIPWRGPEKMTSGSSQMVSSLRKVAVAVV